MVAEVEELKADPTVRAIGTVIEARLDKGKGAIATLLVQQGTLHVQDPIVVGNTFGRVRAMVNDLGRRVKSAEPSTPVSITGLNETPMAGDHFAVYADEKLRVQLVRSDQNVPSSNNVKIHSVLALIISLIPLKQEKSRLLMSSSKQTFKVLLKPLQHLL